VFSNSSTLLPDVLSEPGEFAVFVFIGLHIITDKLMIKLWQHTSCHYLISSLSINQSISGFISGTSPYQR